MPRKATVIPARAVPASRPALCTRAPTPIADGTSATGTRSLPSRAQAGPSTVAMMPVTAASTMSTVRSIRSSATSRAVVKATAPSRAWLTATVSFRGQRSTAAPPSRLTNSAGAAWTDIDRPVAAAEPVMCSTSRFCTVSCIQVPALETRLAADHQRMLRWRRDRHGEREAGAVGGVDVGRAEEEATERYSTTERGSDRRIPSVRLRCTAGPPGQGEDHRGRRVAPTTAQTSAAPPRSPEHTWPTRRLTDAWGSSQPLPDSPAPAL
ncbi:hypothetical protein GCM10017687_09620 [Streptomyces echinatus]